MSLKHQAIIEVSVAMLEKALFNEGRIGGKTRIVDVLPRDPGQLDRDFVRMIIEDDLLDPVPPGARPPRVTVLISERQRMISYEPIGG